MNEKAEKLIGTIKYLSNLEYALINVVEYCQKTSPTLYKDTLKKCKVHLANYKKDLELLRKDCTHNFEYKGHGHVYDFYECTECGKSEDR